VLIAAEILRKEGKLVCCEPAAASLNSHGKKKTKQDKESLLEQIQEIKRRKKEKVEALQELIFKSLAIKNLVRRNKEKAEKEALDAKMSESTGPKSKQKSITTTTKNAQSVSATRIDVVQENPALNQKTQDVISFPFIVLLSSSPENSMNLNMDTSQKQLSIESKKPFNIFGDIDVLLKMRLHYVSRETFEKEIPKNLQKFVSQSFLDALK
jgi:membrane-associated HD superfamily phosphohydrolase